MRTKEESEAWKLFAAAVAGGVAASDGDVVDYACGVADELLEEYVARFGRGAVKPPADPPDPLPLGGSRE